MTQSEILQMILDAHIFKCNSCSEGFFSIDLPTMCPYCKADFRLNDDKVEKIKESAQKVKENENELNTILKEFIEAGSLIEHTRWGSWQEYFHSKLIFHESGLIEVPKDYYLALERQIATSYADLSENEKESDRREARSYLPLLSKALSSQKEELKKKIEGMEKDEDMAQSLEERDRKISYNCALDSVLKLINEL